MSRLVKIKEIIGDKHSNIQGMIPMSRTSWWKGVKENRFPQPIKFGGRSTFWRESDIQALMGAT